MDREGRVPPLPKTVAQLDGLLLPPGLLEPLSEGVPVPLRASVSHPISAEAGRRCQGTEALGFQQLRQSQRSQLERHCSVEEGVGGGPGYLARRPSVAARGASCPRIDSAEVLPGTPASTLPINRQKEWRGGAGRHPARRRPTPSPLQTAAGTPASPPSWVPRGVEAPGEWDGESPLKLLAWIGRR
jgi:hypothetical protein